MLSKANKLLADSIRVIDDALPKEMMEQLLQFYYGEYWKSDWVTSGTDYYFWGRNFGGAGNAIEIDNIESQLNNTEESKTLGRIWHYIRDHYVPDQVLLRIAGAAYTNGSDGYIHVDNAQPDYLSMLIYIHPEWKTEWGGEIAYYTPDRTDIIKFVSPMAGRLVIAPGFIPHRPFAPGRDVNHLRACINYRSRKRESISETR